MYYIIEEPLNMRGLIYNQNQFNIENKCRKNTLKYKVFSKETEAIVYAMELRHVLKKVYKEKEKKKQHIYIDGGLNCRTNKTAGSYLVIEENKLKQFEGFYLNNTTTHSLQVELAAVYNTLILTYEKGLLKRRSVLHLDNKHLINYFNNRSKKEDNFKYCKGYKKGYDHLGFSFDEMIYLIDEFDLELKHVVGHGNNVKNKMVDYCCQLLTCNKIRSYK